MAAPISPTFFPNFSALSTPSFKISSGRTRGTRKQYPAIQNRQWRPQPRATSMIYMAPNSVKFVAITVSPPLVRGSKWRRMIWGAPSAIS